MRWATCLLSETRNTKQSFAYEGFAAWLASNLTMADLVHVDRAVARRILGGDEAAFRDLFDRFFPRLYRFALARLRDDPDTAKDIVQQTFCQAIERLDTYRGEAALYTWFCQICRNVAGRPLPAQQPQWRPRRAAGGPAERAGDPRVAHRAGERRARDRRAARSSSTGSSRRRSMRCRAATARHSNGSTSTGCRCARSPSGCRSARRRPNRC